MVTRLRFVDVVLVAVLDDMEELVVLLEVVEVVELDVLASPKVSCGQPNMFRWETRFLP